ncbi:MAG: hypothetical protein GY861_24445 [bacterium]|nr:hypothetical protein [bacterium]
MTLTEIEDALYSWVDGVLSGDGVITIFSHPNAPRPTTSYALINIITMPQIGHEDTDATLEVDKSTTIEYSALNDLFLSINVYYSGAWDYAKKLRKSLGKPLILEGLYSDGLGFSVASAVRRIPEEIDKQWEERAMFDINFYLRTIDDENIETVQKIQITNELDGHEEVIENP